MLRVGDAVKSWHRIAYPPSPVQGGFSSGRRNRAKEHAGNFPGWTFMVPSHSGGGHRGRLSLSGSGGEASLPFRSFRPAPGHRPSRRPGQGKDWGEGKLSSGGRLEQRISLLLASNLLGSFRPRGRGGKTSFREGSGIESPGKAPKNIPDREELENPGTGHSSGNFRGMRT